MWNQRFVVDSSFAASQDTRHQSAGSDRVSANSDDITGNLGHTQALVAITSSLVQRRHSAVTSGIRWNFNRCSSLSNGDTSSSIASAASRPNTSAPGGSFRCRPVLDGCFDLTSTCSSFPTPHQPTLVSADSPIALPKPLFRPSSHWEDATTKRQRAGQTSIICRPTRDATATPHRFSMVDDDRNDDVTDLRCCQLVVNCSRQSPQSPISDASPSGM